MHSLALLMLLLCLAILYFALTTNLFFLYEASQSGHLETLRRRSGLTPALLFLKGFASCLGSQLVVCLLYPLGAIPGRFFLRPSQAVPLSPADKPPVILIHGLYHNASAWLIFRTRLRRAGFQHLFAGNYNCWTRDFSFLLDQLCSEVERIHTACGTKPILIGQSLGGLLARACASHPRTCSRIAGVATLGAPHRGSKLASLSLGGLGRSLCYRQTLIRRIAAAEAHPNFPCLSLFSPIDNLVLPPDATRITTPGWAEQETPPISHLSLLFHGPTAKMVLDFLNRVCGESRTDGLSK